MAVAPSNLNQFIQDMMSKVGVAKTSLPDTALPFLQQLEQIMIQQSRAPIEQLQQQGQLPGAGGDAQMAMASANPQQMMGQYGNNPMMPPPPPGGGPGGPGGGGGMPPGLMQLLAQLPAPQGNPGSGGLAQMSPAPNADELRRLLSR